MFAYLLCVLFAYYILKPVSQAMFLNKFDVDDLPFLIILVAIGGGAMAYAYSRAAVKTSLPHAVTGTMIAAVACLVAIWWLLGFNLPWMLYVLNVFVGLFNILLVTQGWLVAGNTFNAREARRVYPLLTMAMVVGAAFGGEFTRRTARLIGSRNLLLASAVLVMLAYAAFLLLARERGLALKRARASEGGETHFAASDIARDIGRSRHLQTIIAIMAVMFIVDVLVNFQFQAMAKARYSGEHLTVFLGSFYGLWLNLSEFVVQSLVTAAVVSRFGVGGTLQIMPTAILLASFGTVAAPGVLSSSAVRLTEACSRYTLNRTGQELLYMPLPTELRNRIKAFIDIFFDRMSRGAGGLLLILFTRVFDLTVREIAMVVIGLTIPWIWVSLRARKEYIATIRKRLAARRLDLESVRITVRDPETLALLEETAASGNARQAAYALSLLGDAPGFNLAPLLGKLVASPSDEVRAKVYELARSSGFAELTPQALREAGFGGATAAVKAAVLYVMSVSPDRERLAGEFLDSENQAAAEGAVEALAAYPESAAALLTREWLDAAVSDARPERRALAAAAVGVRGDHGTEVLYRLLNDADARVVTAACRAAGVLGNRAYLYLLIERLANPHIRGDVIEALARFGPQICGALGDILADTSAPMAIRRQIPRVLKLIPRQRSVDVLLTAIGNMDLSLRGAVLKALNRLRESAPELNFENAYVTEQIYREARYYFELAAALAPLRDHKAGAGTAAALLVRTLEERLQRTLERLFRLLGLRYPPKEIYSSYLAFSRRRSEDVTAALEFLDNVLARDIKKVLLPLLDAPEHVPERGRDLFGVEIPDAESALRELIGCGDAWLTACAMSAAAELQFRKLAPEIAQAAECGEPEVTQVAQAVQAVLA